MHLARANRSLLLCSKIAVFARSSANCTLAGTGGLRPNPNRIFSRHYSTREVSANGYFIQLHILFALLIFRLCTSYYFTFGVP
jgi:hypothetical protein